MLRDGIVRPSSSPWASPAHLVPKATGGWRLCGDYRRLNTITQKDSYPLPNIYAFASHLHGAKIFSHIDLIKGFWQVPMNEQDIKKTAMATPLGLFEFKRMPFGLKNASNSFQRLMNELVRGLPGIFVYLDDILIYSEDLDQHKRRLKSLFDRLNKFGLKLATNKCFFAVNEIEFLGFHVSAKGVKPPTHRIDAIINMPPPKTTDDLRKFLGTLNFYKRFLPNLSAKISDLYAQCNRRGPLLWTDQLQLQFVAAKQAIAAATTLAFPKEGAPTCISSDASAFGMAGVLEQFEAGHWRPLAFFSRKLSEVEKRDSTFNRELAAAFNSVRHFHHLVEGRGCALVVDHEPLRGAFLSHKDALTDKQRRQLSYLAEMVVGIYPIKGKHNIVADTLSRLPIGFINAFTCRGLDLDHLHQAQLDDRKMAHLQAPRFQKVRIDARDLLCDVSKTPPKIVIPASARRYVMDFFHQQSHQGVKATRNLIASHCVWPRMSEMVRNYVRGCQNCQMSKVQVHNKPPSQQYLLPNGRFAHLHLDLVGPMPESHNGNVYLFTCIDRYTRFPIAIPTNSATAVTVIEAFMLHWVSVFGLPERVTTDNGPCFISGQWRGLMQQFNIVHHFSTHYHPESNGIIERWHRTLKDSLTARGGSWEQALPLIMLHLRATVKEDLRFAPSELVFGTLPILPGAVLPRQELVLEPNVFGSAFYDVSFPGPQAPRWHRADRDKYIELDFSGTDQAFVRREGHQRPLTPAYSGPHRIISRHNRVFKMLINGKEQLVTVDRLKPFVPWRDPFLFHA